MRFSALSIAGTVLLACAPRTETPEHVAARIRAESDSARATFETIFADIGREFSAGQADSLVARYADDAHVLPPNSRPVHGRDAVRQMYTAAFQNGPVGALQFRVENVTVNGPVAVVRTAWVFTPPAGTPIPVDTGAAIDHLERVDGRWLIMEETWRSDLPLPPPPPRRKS